MKGDSCRNYSCSYRSQIAWLSHFAGILGMKRGFVCFRPGHLKKEIQRVIKFSMINFSEILTLFNLLLRL